MPTLEPRKAVVAWSLYAAALAACVMVAVGVFAGGALAVGILIGLMAVFAAWRFPLETVLVLIAYIPLEGFLMKWGPDELTGATLMPELLIAAAAFAAVARRGPPARRSTVLHWLLLIAAFVLVGGVSAYVNQVSPFDSVYWVRTMIRYMPAALVIAVLVDGPTWIRRVAPVFAASIVLQAGVALVQLGGGDTVRSFFAPGDVVIGETEFVSYSASALSGISGTMGFYNTFGLYAVLCFAVCVGSAYAWRARPESHGGGRGRLLLLDVGSAAAAGCVLVSGSRQSIAALVTVIVLVLVLLGTRGFGWKGLPLVLGAASIIGVALLWPGLAGPLQWIPERFGTALSGSFIDQSMRTDRLSAVLTVAPAVLAEAPLLGVGPGALGTASGTEVAQNLGLSSGSVGFVQDVGWAGLLIQTGVAGFVLVAGAFGWLVLRARRAWQHGVLDKGLYVVVVTVVAATAVGMLASSALLIRSVSLLVWCVAGLALRGSDADEA